MKVNTKKRKKARQGFEEIYGVQELAARMFHVLQAGKQGLDALHMELGAMLCEAVMDMEREELSGPDYAPRHQGTYKWAYQDGPVYCGDRKIRVRHPRLRGPEGEIHLSSYQTLKNPGAFSEELLGKVLSGISERRSSTRPEPLASLPHRYPTGLWRRQAASSRSSRSAIFLSFACLPFSSTPSTGAAMPSSYL